MNPATDRPSVTDRLLEMAETFAAQGRPAMAEAARRAAVRPSPPLPWRNRSVPLADDLDLRPGQPLSAGL